MAIARIQGSWHSDSSMRDGYLRVEVEETGDRSFFVSRDTFDTLSCRSQMAEAADFAWAIDAGEYLIPMSIIAGDQRREVEMALSFLEPAESDTCTLPTCLQPSSTYERGFPLCTDHAELLASWDALV